MAPKTAPTNLNRFSSVLGSIIVALDACDGVLPDASRDTCSVMIKGWAEKTNKSAGSQKCSRKYDTIVDTAKMLVKMRESFRKGILSPKSPTEKLLAKSDGAFDLKRNSAPSVRRFQSIFIDFLRAFYGVDFTDTIDKPRINTQKSTKCTSFSSPRTSGQKSKRKGKGKGTSTVHTVHHDAHLNDCKKQARLKKEAEMIERAKARLSKPTPAPAPVPTSVTVSTLEPPGGARLVTGFTAGTLPGLTFPLLDQAVVQEAELARKREREAKRAEIERVTQQRFKEITKVSSDQHKRVCEEEHEFVEAHPFHSSSLSLDGYAHFLYERAQQFEVIKQAINTEHKKRWLGVQEWHRRAMAKIATE